MLKHDYMKKVDFAYESGPMVLVDLAATSQPIHIFVAPLWTTWFLTISL